MKPIIPIFFHIPKCAGTFVLGCMHSMFRQYYRNRLESDEQQDNRQLQKLKVIIPNHGMLTVLAFTPSEVYENENTTTKIDDYSSELSIFKLFSLVNHSEIELFSIVIEHDFDYVVDFLKDFTFTLNAEDSINDVFKKSYNITLQDCKVIETNRNRNPDKQDLKLSDLDEKTQTAYKNKTKFDHLLFKHFIK